MFIWTFFITKTQEINSSSYALKSWNTQFIVSPVPVAARSKAWVYGRSPAEIVSSNPTQGMDVCLLWLLCVVR